MQINKVISAEQQSGDGIALQPASPLSEEVRAQLFDEFANQEPVVAPPVSSQTIFFAMVLAAVIAAVALYIIKQVKPNEVQSF